MDRELRRMQDQIQSFCNVELRRTQLPKSKCTSPEQHDDGLLLLGLILILALDNSDKTLMLLLLYIFM